MGLDVSVFLLKAIGEYIRLLFRSFIPRPLRDVAGKTFYYFSFSSFKPSYLSTQDNYFLGEVVLVTGAGHGIGREVALQMAKLGAIVICIDKNVENNK